MNDKYTCNGWACTDCVMLLANGESPTEMSEAEASAWEEEISQRNAGYNIALGMLREDHDCATNYTVTTSDGKTHEFRADSEQDARDQFGFHHVPECEPGIVSVTAHDLETESDRGGECECEHSSFSWSPCDVCGSNLGGRRDAVSFFKITEVA